MTRLSLATLLGIACSAAATAAVVDAIVATVGNEIILMSEVMEDVEPLAVEIQQQARNEAEYSLEMRRAMQEALDQAIEFKILFRQAQLAGVQIEDALIEQRLDEVRRRYPSEADFQDALRAAGETMSDIRERLRKQTMALGMGYQKRRQLEQAVTISEADVEQYYRDNIEDFRKAERLLLRRIFLGATTPEARAQARARLEVVREELALGANFGELARQHSEGPEAKQGGRVGWVERGDLVVALEDVAFALAAGGTSNIIDTEFGCVLLSVDDREEAGIASLEEVRTEIEPVLRAKGADEQYRNWIAELRQRSRVRVLM